MKGNRSGNKIYEETKTIFPTAEVDRMDTDSMKTKFAYEKLYEKNRKW